MAKDSANKDIGVGDWGTFTMPTGVATKMAPGITGVVMGQVARIGNPVGTPGRIDINVVDPTDPGGAGPQAGRGFQVTLTDTSFTGVLHASGSAY